MAFITITGGLGCELEKITQLVSKKLELPLYDNKKIHDEAVKLGLSSYNDISMDEKVPGHLDRIMNHKPEVYLDIMKSIVFDCASRGKGIFLGHGGQILLKEFSGVLNIRLIGSLKERALFLSKEEGLSQESAEKIIHKSDNEKRGFIKYAFHQDWDDTYLYDLVLNVDKFSNEDIASLIVKTAETEVLKSGLENSEVSLESYSLLKLVESSIFESNTMSQFSVEIVDNSVIKIIGLTYTEEGKETLLKLVKSIKGVTGVIPQIITKPLGF